ncbi:MAG: ATP-binding domain-containing protein [Candidatus Pacebacteria bacterium]|nr:ATP-binding domain-containing protein [Candidatus Paceibacterota bacterium]
MILSSDKKTAIKKMISWFKAKNKKRAFVTLGGYAGTGKTTLIAALRKDLKKIDPKLKVGFASFTGKAARVLRLRLKEGKAVYSQDMVGTIHSLIYSPVTNEKEEIIGWEKKKSIDRSLIIIDEASMVDGLIWQDLLGYSVPIIAVGDHGQLPPIRGNFNLMKKPDFYLTKIHRQAAENPIVDLSIQAREKGRIKPGFYSDQVKKYSKEEEDIETTVKDFLGGYNRETLILCGYNHTRKKLNNFIRQALGFSGSLPQINDRVICLRNNHQKKIYNGMLGTIIGLEERGQEWYKSQIKMDGENKPYRGLISANQFNERDSLNFTQKRAQIMAGDLFDFGYALTVHKAQGSQAKRVILFEERFPQMTNDDWRRWLYTAVTRAEEELYIFGN